MTVSHRPETPDDEPFLRSLVIGVVSAQLGADLWPEPMRGHLLGMQYSARRHSIRAGFPDARSEVILADGRPVGWLVVARTSGEIRVIEIMTLASERGKGIGTAVIEEQLSVAAAAECPVRLTVEAANVRAIRFYHRLGFRDTGGNQVHRVMEAYPARVRSSSA